MSFWRDLSTLFGRHPPLPDTWGNDPDVSAARDHQHDQAQAIQRLEMRDNLRTLSEKDLLRALAEIEVKTRIRATRIFRGDDT